MHRIEIFLNNIDIIMIVIRRKMIYFVDVNWPYGNKLETLQNQGEGL